VKTYLDCVPCFVRQGLDAARMATDDEVVHERVVRKVLEHVAEVPFDRTPAHMSHVIYGIVRDLSGCEDPYIEVKEHSNRFALDLYPEMQTLVDKSDDPFETAVRVAIAGNIIDFGVTGTVDLDCVRETVAHAIEAPLDEALLDMLRSAARDADDILYLVDNAGEIVFDRLLVEHMPREKVTVVVKGGPIINDATIADARSIGLTELVEVVESGTRSAGTILETCSRPFRERFARADLVIAKGQGNYEALNDVDKPVFFLLKAKCAVIARHLDCRVGDIVIAATQPLRATA